MEREIEKPEIERLKEAEGALNFLLRHPDLILRMDVRLAVMDYIERRNAGRRHWIRSSSE